MQLAVPFLHFQLQCIPSKLLNRFPEPWSLLQEIPRKSPASILKLLLHEFRLNPVFLHSATHQTSGNNKYRKCSVPAVKQVLLLRLFQHPFLLRFLLPLTDCFPFPVKGHPLSFPGTNHLRRKYLLFDPSVLPDNQVLK